MTPRLVRGSGLGARSCSRVDGSYASDHGSWYARLELPPGPDGERKIARRGGFPSRKAAQAWIDEAKGKVAKGVDVQQRTTVAEAFDEWLSAKADVRKSTRHGYASHGKVHIKPVTGRIELGRLRKPDLDRVFAAIDQRNEDIRAGRTRGRITGPVTKTRIKATLRSFLSDMVAEGAVPVNFAKLVKLPPGKRPKARVWTQGRTVQWTADYELRLAAARERAKGRPVNEFKIWRDVASRPSPVMVWTPAQTGQFLDHAAGHRLSALYHLIAFRGLRRGEACGLRWEDLDLEERMMTVRWQITQLGGEGEPKTDASDAVVALDSGTVAVLRVHREQQLEERRVMGSAWVESGYAFTKQDGSPLYPEFVSDEFERLAFGAGLPPIRLHDLRHGTASIMHAAGVDMKVIQATLRYSSSSLTRDTYTSVFNDVDREAAEAAAAIVPRAHRSTEGAPSGLTSGPPQDQ